jgi:hypothetical protein
MAGRFTVAAGLNRAMKPTHGAQVVGALRAQQALPRVTHGVAKGAIRALGFNNLEFPFTKRSRFQAPSSPKTEEYGAGVIAPRFLIRFAAGCVPKRDYPNRC